MQFSRIVCVAVVLAWLSMPRLAMSQVAFQWLMAMGVTICCVFVVRHARRQASDVANGLQLGMLLAAGGSAFVALTQYVEVAPQVLQWLSIDRNGGVDAHLGQRNHLASLLNVGIVALLHYVGQFGFEAKRRPLLSTLAFGAMLVLMTFMLAATGSRTGAVQLIAILCGMWFLRRQHKKSIKQWILVVGLMYVLSVIALPTLAHMGISSTLGLVERVHDANAGSRWILWSNVMELVWQSPLTGHGWRSLAYMHYSTDFSGARFMEMLDNAHNLPLHLAVELGLPVALAFCGAVAWLIWRGKPWKETRADRQLAWGILMVIGIHSLVEYPLWYGPFFITTVLCVGILCADAWQNWLSALSKAAQRAVRLGLGGLAALLFVGTVFAAFDYHRASQIYLQPDQRSSWYAADPLGVAKKSVLFQSHAKFAELQITPLTRESAPRILELSSELVHWSPEPRIIEKLIESATILQLDDVAAFHLRCFKRAYPVAYAAWEKGNQR